MGCSNPHPHCQIWASSFLPNEPKIKEENQKKYFKNYGRPLLMDYMSKELEKQVKKIIIILDACFAMFFSCYQVQVFDEE